MRGSGASPDSAVPGSNRRAQAIHGLLAPDPRTTASFARWVSVASSIPAPACPAETKIATPRRTSLQGVRVRVVHGCTTPACWSRMRNHAADEIPLQRRPPPEAEAFAGHRNQRRLPPKPGGSGAFQAGQIRHHSIGRRSKKEARHHVAPLEIPLRWERVSERALRLDLHVGTFPVKESSAAGEIRRLCVAGPVPHWRRSRSAGGAVQPGVARQGLMSSPPRRV